MKTCNKCNETKPLEEFWVAPRNADKKHGTCRDCMMKASAEKRALTRKPVKEEVGEGLKTCTHCKETKSLDDFHRSSSSKDGRNPACKACRTMRYTKGESEEPAPVIQHKWLKDGEEPQECWYCQKPIEIGKRYRWMKTSMKQPAIHHPDCWKEHLAWGDRLAALTPTKENVKTCKNGHERTEENTNVYITKRGWRQQQCLDCRKATKRRAKAARLGSVHW